MPDELEQILQRVASGELSPADAEPLIAALEQEAPRPAPERSSPPPPAASTSDALPERARRVIRLQVTEGGRPVVNLRVPTSFAGLAGSVLPGLSTEDANRLRDAIRSGTVGRILEIQDEDGDGVVISAE